MLAQLRKCDRKAFFLINLIFIGIIITACAGKKTVTQTEDDETSRKMNVISDVNITTEKDALTISIKGEEQLTYTSIKKSDPLGILFFFPKTKPGDQIKTLYEVDTKIVSKVEVSQITEEDEEITKILLLLKNDVPYRILPDQTDINIVFASDMAEPELEVKDDQEAVEVSEEVELIPATLLKTVNVRKYEQKIRVKVSANGAIKKYKSFVLKNPPRIVFDLYEIESPYKKLQVIKVNNKYIKRVRHLRHADKVRLVLDTKKAFLNAYAASTVIDGLEVEVGNVTPAEDYPQKMAKSHVTKKEKKSKAKVVRKKKQATIKSRKASSSSNVAWINRIDFRSDENGKSTIIVGTTELVDFELKKVKDKLLQLKLFNTKVPKYRKRPLITTRFESAVNRITPFYKSSKNKASLVAIELREDVEYNVKQDDDVILIHFQPSSIPPKPLEQANLPSWKSVLADAGRDEVPGPEMEKVDTFEVEPVMKDEKKPVSTQKGITTKPSQIKTKTSSEKKAVPATSANEKELAKEADETIFEGIDIFENLASSRRKKRRYTGEKIALDFYDTDIKNVFRIIREISGKNFAIDKDVTGKVTLTLDKPVPWDQVLELVLKMNNLGMTYEGDIIRIATLQTLTAEEKALQEKIKAEQKAKEVQEALEPLVTEYISINYSDATTDVLPHVKGLITKDRGNVTVDKRNNQLIVTDVELRVEQIKEIVNKIDKVTPQVIIEARIVEVDTRFSRDLGFILRTSAGPYTNNQTGWSGEADGLMAMNFPASSDSGFVVNFTRLATDGTPFLLDAQLNALEIDNKGKIITAPKVATLDNKKARIEQGLEYPFIERDAAGLATVKFKEINLVLEVTPTVTPDERVLMKVLVEKKDIAEFTGGIPSLDIIIAETELLVNDGDTIVIGGILKTTIGSDTSGWPGLKNIPILGWFFKTELDRKSDQELLIFLTPQIVQLEQRKIM